MKRAESRIFRIHRRTEQIAILAVDRGLAMACVAVLHALNWFSDSDGGQMRASNDTIAARIGASRRTVVDAVRKLVTVDLLVPMERPKKRTPVMYAFGPAISPEHPINTPAHAHRKAALRDAALRLRRRTRRIAREAHRAQLDGQILHSQ